MADDVKKEALDFLEQQIAIDLATVDESGQPMVHPVAVITMEGKSYFMTSKISRKVVNIQKNNKVAFGAYTAGASFAEIKGLQMEGIMEEVSDQDLFNKVIQLFFQRFPPMKEMPKDPNSCMMQITPTHGFYLDYAKGFGHRDELHF